MRWLRFVPVAVIVMLVAVLVWRLASPPDAEIQSQMVGKPIPEFAAAAAVAGTPTLSSADLADGNPRLVNIFASWCVPCIAEAPVLTELKRRGVTIVGIAVRDRPEDVAEFLAEHGNPFERIGSDPQSSLQLAFGSAGVPESFVVDGRGVIRMQHIGPIEPDEIPAIVAAVESAK
ncbi:MAG TPA: DsbE family thiol:disulfide interchange protein [Sphingomicrobium sp.]|nr:DsbE family thiol:disulfide interchange protein [Sphingomicrobium sp.]